MKVLGMGNALLDVLIKIKDDSLLKELQFPRGSMTLIDRQRCEQIDKVTVGHDRSMVTGGSAANTIHGLTQLNVPTGFIGSVGKDEQGDFYIKDMTSRNIQPIFERSENPSGRANAFISSDGERTFGTYLGAALDLTAEFLQPDFFKDWDFFHIEGYLVQNHDLIETALKYAKEAGCKVSIDMASYNVVEENIEFLQRVIPTYVDIIFANEEEAKSFTGKEPEEALDILAEVASVALVKIGVGGAWVKTKDTRELVAGFKTVPRDTTGAGDLFASGFLYGMANDYPMDTCTKIGNLLASKVIEEIGPKIRVSVWEKIMGEIDNISGD